MAISVVQAVGAASGSSAATSVSPSISPTTAGSLVVLCVAGANGVSPYPPYTISDSSSQAWAQGPGGAGSNGAYTSGYIFYFENSASITSVAVTTTTSYTSLACFFFEVSGIATSSAADVSAEDGPLGSTAMPTVTASGPTAQANEIAIAMVASNGGPSATGITGGWTAEAVSLSGYRDVRVQPFYQILSSTTTLSIGGSGTASWLVAFESFEAASAPPPTDIEGALPLQSSAQGLLDLSLSGRT